MTEPLSCPYCNALVVPPPGAQAGERVPCARCGETFSLPASFQTSAIPNASPAGGDQPPAPSPVVRRWPNALVAAVVVGGMMLLAAGVLQFALLTQQERRGNDIWPARPERVPLRFVLAMLTVLVSAGVTFLFFRRRSEATDGSIDRSRVAGVAVLWMSAAVTIAVLLLRGSRFEDEGALDPVRPIAPAELEGLRYLPGDIDALAAIHVGEILEDPESEKLLDLPLSLPGSGQNLGTVRQVLARLEQMTGLRREVVDHLVVGAKLGLLCIHVIVRTRKDYNNGRVHVALNTKSHPTIEGRERGLYRFHQNLLPGFTEGLLACPDTRTIVLGWNARLSDMPKEPHQGTGHLPQPLMKILKERVSPWGQVWVAGHSAEWSKLLLQLLAMARVNEKDQQLLSKVRTFAVWLDLKEKRVLHAELRCADPSAAEAVRNALTARFQKVAQRLTIVRKDEWVSLQYRLDS